MSTVRLKPFDGEARELDVLVACLAVTIKDMIEATNNLSEDEKKEAVPLPNISSVVLDKVIEYMKYHYDDPLIATDSDNDSDSECDLNENIDHLRTDNISEWDKKYINVERETLFDLIFAANFLNIKGLLELGCKTAANQIRGKSAEQVRLLWDIECDLSKEDEERLKKENAWTEEK